MSAEELFQEGRLEDAIEAQIQVVKGSPADGDARFLLFTLLCFTGDLERATRQLDALASTDPQIQAGSLVYRQLLEAEAQRREVLGGEGRPVLAPDPPEDLEHRLTALACAREGDGAGADRALEAAAEASVAVGGKLNGESFEAIRDTDDLLCTVLEVFAGGRYLWLPFSQIRKLELSEPSRKLDLLWISASLQDARGNDASVFLPVLYDGSHSQAGSPLRVGRMTEWTESESLGARGVGQRVLLSVQGESERETGLLDLRLLEIEGAG